MIRLAVIRLAAIRLAAIRLALLFLVCLASGDLMSGTAWADQKLSADSVNAATWSDKIKPEQLNPATVKLQILLARAHFSPGEIDGRLGENVRKAASVYAAENHLDDAGETSTKDASALFRSVWDRLSPSADGPVIVDYVITKKDVRGPFVKKIPSKMEKMKGLRHLRYRNPKEELAERFHMSPELLQRLNPGKRFDHAGESISVAAVEIPPVEQTVERIEVDVQRQTLKAVGENDTLLAYYPATVGSEEKPAPIGTFKVKAIVKNPTYRYNPKYAFKGVKTNKPFTIAAGPNNPVGTVWIDLSAKSYGIHGTPEPSKISKSESHGCIRLTNWDVEQLAAMVRKGTKVVIRDGADVAGAQAERAPRR